MTATYTWDELLGGESAILIRLGQLLFVWKKGDTTIKVIPSGPSEAEAEAEPDENPTLDVIFEIDVPPRLLGRHDAEGFESFCREFVGMAGSVALTWGREAPDSPMAGAQALGSGSLLEDALRKVADQAGIEVPNIDSLPIALVAENMCEECDAFLGKAHRGTCSKAGRVVEMADATEKFTTLEQSQTENPLLGLDRATVEIILRALPPQSEVTEDDREKMGELRVGLAKFVTGCEEAES